jgi:membrane dipeptidase
VAPEGEATVQKVADHVEHLASIAGRNQWVFLIMICEFNLMQSSVGIGSDFDGIPETPVGLEDVSKYPALVSNFFPLCWNSESNSLHVAQFAELYKRGWSKTDLAGLSNGNLLRIFEGAEKVAKNLQFARTVPVMDLYDKRPDLPIRQGPQDL